MSCRDSLSDGCLAHDSAVPCAQVDRVGLRAHPSLAPMTHRWTVASRMTQLFRVLKWTASAYALTVVARWLLTRRKAAEKGGDDDRVPQLRHHSGPNFARFSAPPSRYTRRVLCSIRGAHAGCVLIGACDPML